MADGEPGRVSRKAPRFFGLPDDAAEDVEGTPAEVGVSTEAPSPVRGPVTREERERPPDDPQAADTAELLVDPVARREVGAIVEARHLLADARELLRLQALRRAPRHAPAGDESLSTVVDDGPPAPADDSKSAAADGD